MAGEEPPYLTVGTDVSAKYKGAFCEAKIKKVTRSVKCKVTFKNNNGNAFITDDQVRGTLRVGAHVEAKHPEKNQFLEAVINKLHDYSQYTVVFDDGDETTLRRTSLCLKSGRHFAESETLDQLPLTHPEHFGTPVMGTKGGRKRRSLRRSPLGDVSSEDDEPVQKKEVKLKEPDPDMGKVVCVELCDKKKQKDNWFPCLVVSSSAHDVRVKAKEEYLVRSFKDGRYHVIGKKDTREFTREIGARVDNNTLKTAVERAMQYVEKDDLPPHWDRDALFRTDASSDDDNSDDNSDSETSDDEPSEEKDRFVAQLYKFMDDRGTPINKAPTVSNKDLNLYKLFKMVQKMGGYNRVTNQMQWKTVYTKMGLPSYNNASSHQMKKAYKKYLHSFEGFERKLGCTMGTSTRSSRVRHLSGRNLIMTRDRDREFKAAGRRKREVKPAKQEPEVIKPSLKDAIVEDGAKIEEVQIGGPDADEEKEECVKATEIRPIVGKSAQAPADVADKPPSRKERVLERKIKEDSDVGSDSEDDRPRAKSDHSKSEESPSPKRRGRKKTAKTDDDKSQDSDDERENAGFDVNIIVGDRVKVKYGRGRQQKIYEAKVLKADDEDGDRIFFVHYTGWNMRYDEWVKRHRIVENLTQKISGKRMRRASSKNKVSGKRGRPLGNMTAPGRLGRKACLGSATRSRTTRSDKKSLSDSPFASGLEPRRRMRKSLGRRADDSSGEESGSDSGGDSDIDVGKRTRSARRERIHDELETSFEEKDRDDDDDDDEEEDEDDDDDEEDYGGDTQGEQEKSEDEMDSVRSSHSAGSRIATRREKAGRKTPSAKDEHGGTDDGGEVPSAAVARPTRKPTPSKVKGYVSDEDESEHSRGSEEPSKQASAKRGRKKMQQKSVPPPPPPKRKMAAYGKEIVRSKKGRPRKVISDDELPDDSFSVDKDSTRSQDVEEDECEGKDGGSSSHVLKCVSEEMFSSEAAGLEEEKDFSVDLSEIMLHSHDDEDDGKCIADGKGMEECHDGGSASSYPSSPFSCDVSELVSTADKVQIADVAAVNVERNESMAVVEEPVARAVEQESNVVGPADAVVVEAGKACAASAESGDSAEASAKENASKTAAAAESLVVDEFSASPDKAKTEPHGKNELEGKEKAMDSPDKSAKMDVQENTTCVPVDPPSEASSQASDVGLGDKEKISGFTEIVSEKSSDLPEKAAAALPSCEPSVGDSKDAKSSSRAAGGGSSKSEPGDSLCTADAGSRDRTAAAEALSGGLLTEPKTSAPEESILKRSLKGDKSVETSIVTFERLPSSSDEETKVDAADEIKKCHVLSAVEESSTDDGDTKPSAARKDPPVIDKFDALLEDTSWRRVFHTEPLDKKEFSGGSPAKSGSAAATKEASMSGVVSHSGKCSKKERHKKNKKPEKRKISDSDNEGSTEEEEVKVKKRRSKDDDKKEGGGGSKGRSESKAAKRSRDKKSRPRKGDSDREDGKSQKRKVGSAERVRHKECKRKRAGGSEKGRKAKDDDRAAAAASLRDSDDASSFSSDGGAKKERRKSKKHRSRDTCDAAERKRARKSKPAVPCLEHTSDDSSKETLAAAAKKVRKEERSKGRRKEKAKKSAHPVSDDSDSSKISGGGATAAAGTTSNAADKMQLAAAATGKPVGATKTEPLAGEGGGGGGECDISRYLMCEEDVPASPVGADGAGLASAEDKTAEAAATVLVGGGAAQGSGGSGTVPLSESTSFIPISVAQKYEADPSVVLDNTPPTTPESNGTAVSDYVHLHHHHHHHRHHRHQPHHNNGGSDSTSPSGDTTDTTAKSSQGSSPSASSDDATTAAAADRHHGLLTRSVAGDHAEVATEDEFMSDSNRESKLGSKRSSVDVDDGVSLRKRKSHKKHLVPSALDLGRSASSAAAAAAAVMNKQKQPPANKSPRSCDADDFSQMADIFLGAANSSLNSQLTSHAAIIDNLLPANTALRSPRPSKFNFYVDLDEYLDASERIAILQEKLTELRRTYLGLKAELACIDRRRKKLKRKEKEATSSVTTATTITTTTSVVDCS